ncbi:DUF4127 family protein [Oscillospiraceae bacterium 38-13]
MKKRTRLWAAALALMLLAGCGRTEPLPYPEPASSEPGKTIAYVPLDDRPDNVERVVYLAESLGYALAMPDRDLYRTALDHQPLNGNGTQRGDPWALCQWVLEQEEAGCDRYILSLDQLLYGGLVASRSVEGFDIPLPGGGSVRSYSMLEELLAALSAGGDNTVWLLDSIMRLAPTVGYEGGTLEDYNTIRAFGALPRRTLEGDALNLEDIDESYWWGPNGESLRSQTKEDGTYETALRHVRSRGRKMLLSYVVQDTLSKPGYENFRLLIGIDDSSLEDCIQKNEIAFLRQGLRTGEDGRQWDWLLSGVDDLAFKAVARLYLDETDWQGASVSVTYTGGTEDRPACEYDFQPLTETMAEHLEFFGLTEAGEGGDFAIEVLTQPEDGAQKDVYRKRLIENLQGHARAGRPTVLIDASNGAFGASVYDALVKDVELGRLTAYSGMLDMAIVTGTALSHGAARYAVLKNGENTGAMDRAWARTLADSVIKDFCYKGVVRNDLLAYIRNELGGDPNNFWSPELDREDLLRRLEKGMERETTGVIRNLERSRFLSALGPEGPEEKRWGGIALENYRFPWDRAFEIGMDIRLGEFRDA